MLIIRCKEGETILVNADIEIKILSLGAGHIKFGIIAPLDVRVLRKDVEVTRRQNVAAASASTEHFLKTPVERAIHLFSNNVAIPAQTNGGATDKELDG